MHFYLSEEDVQKENLEEGKGVGIWWEVMSIKRLL